MNGSVKKQIVVLVGSLLVATSVFAAEGTYPKPTKKLTPKEVTKNINYRKGYFTILGSHFYGTIKPMAIDKKVEFDMVAVRKSVDAIYSLSKIDLLERGMGLNTIIRKKTKVKGLIWVEWDKFTKLYVELIDKIENLKLATDRDKDFLVGDYAKELQKTCKSCHDRYLN